MNEAADSQHSPCKYRAGRELGRGTYAIVKEMEHISTERWYAGKIISKKLMAGHEASINNELRILRRLPRKKHQGESHLLTLTDYFETTNNVYLITELCSGGELFDRIKNRSVGDEAACARITRQLVEGVCELHMLGIVHRDLKPENCLLRQEGSDDLVIADFGMARVLNDNQQLTSLCGTPGYMAPEMLLRTGHGRPVDMWAVGVIALFVLTGVNPFQGAGGQKTVLNRFSLRGMLDHVWRRCSEMLVSPAARDFVEGLLRFDPSCRMTAEQALRHPWLVQPCCWWYPTPTASPQFSPQFLPQLSGAVSDYDAISVSDVNKDSCDRLVQSAACAMSSTKQKKTQHLQQPADLLAIYLEAAEVTTNTNTNTNINININTNTAAAAAFNNSWIPLMTPPRTPGSHSIGI
ncbi:Calcium/calmodulin-dependent protein kinase type I [Coemansia asiatica]|uniref:Calcium/calmodulin-dependent protein kinase type I n=1 Tax=Coemansia asiatica TaxID=1052880 RepID=A0A9W8CHF5_9FUNG|nr:Calcium/calmodulin-dependent protein kinase type I [Coemansia asiatica]